MCIFEVFFGLCHAAAMMENCVCGFCSSYLRSRMEIISIFMDMCVRSETERSFLSLLSGRLFVEIVIFVCILYGRTCLKMLLSMDFC